MFKKNRLIGGILAVMLGCLTLEAKTFQEVCAAAEKGDADAQFELGLYHSVGICVKNDRAAGEKWFRKAAAQGHVAARSTCLSEGYGVQKDLEKAGEIARKAAEGGDPWAQFCLGTYYGVKKDPAQSAAWFRKAAAQGNAWGQVFAGMAGLGLLKGVPKDPVQAVRWLRQAAEQGHPLGQFFLAGCHIGGEGVPQDRKQAVYWLRRAAAQGLEPAKAALKKLGE